MPSTQHSIQQIIKSSLCDQEETFLAFQNKITDGMPTRDENPMTHFCVYFLPYNPVDKKVFIVHHKKSGLWISPGGHIDKGEVLLEAVNREIEEELGISNHFKEDPEPFLLTLTPIDNQIQTCKMHYDIWYLMRTDGKDFKIDPAEFHATKWMTIQEAMAMTTNQANLKAFEVIGGME